MVRDLDVCLVGPAPLGRWPSESTCREAGVGAGGEDRVSRHSLWAVGTNATHLDSGTRDVLRANTHLVFEGSRLY